MRHDFLKGEEGYLYHFYFDFELPMLLILLLLHYVFFGNLKVVLISSNSEIILLEEDIKNTWLLVDSWAGSGQSKASAPFPHPPLECTSYPSLPRFQGHSLEREQCVVEAIWKVSVAEPRKAAVKMFKILADSAKIYSSWDCLRQALYVSSSY